MAIDDRLLRFENAFTTLSELAARSDGRSSRLEESFVMLTELAVKAGERMDTRPGWTNKLGEAQANTNVKLATLEGAQAYLNAKMATLKDTVDPNIEGRSQVFSSRRHIAKRSLATWL